MTHLFLIAGEPSGDKLGAALMEGLQELDSLIEFTGVGGDLMSKAGLSSLFPISDLSVMGLVEVVPKIPTLLKRISQTANAVIDQKPRALITIDSPDFCMRVAKRVKAELPDLKVIHYVAPSVWAWRPERATKMAKHVDHVLALLPFEPPYMQAAGMSCDFVGHPIAAENTVSKQIVQEMFQHLSVRPDLPIFTVLPGSRAGEISKLLPVFKSVVHNVSTKHPDMQFVLPTISNLEAVVSKTTKTWDQPIKVAALSERHKKALFQESEMALAASGTISLELAAAGCAHVIAYKANWMTTRMVKKMAQIDTANLVNILTESHVIPEYLFERCDGKLISSEVLDVLNNPNKVKSQITAMKQAMTLLGQGDPDLKHKAAKSVLSAF